MNITFIASRNNTAGDHLVLWSHGNYIYEIETFRAGKSLSKMKFESDSDIAMDVFEQLH